MGDHAGLAQGRFQTMMRAKGVDLEGQGRRRFTIVRCLGRGGFGEVYRATMSSPGGLDAEVAVKVLRRDLDPRGQAVQRLKDEGKLLARLSHPTILKVHDLLLLDGRVALVTEFVDGEDLTALLATRPPMSPRALVEVVGQVASALDAAWNAPVEGSDRPLRLVHRDIKPSNVRISRHGEVKLLDFGIARADSVTREARTQTDVMIGSPAYMAPERYVDPTLRPESDVFALGSTLFEGLAGDRFYGDLPVPMLAMLAIDEKRYERHLAAQMARLPALPDALRDLLRHTLAHAPGERPSAGELASRCDLLADALAGPSLARTCRDRAWSVEVGDVGELDGRVLSEGTIAAEPPALVAPTVAQAGSAPVTTTDPSRGRRLGLAAGVVAAGGAALLGIGLLAVASGLALQALGPLAPSGPAAESGSPPAEAPAPVPAEIAAPAPTDPPAVGAPAAAAPVRGAGPNAAQPQPRAPISDAPSPAPASPPSPAPAPPSAPASAVPAPTPEAPSSTGSVAVVGNAVVELVSGGARFSVPASVPPGSYQVHASIAGRDPLILPAPLLVVAGGDHEVSCNERFYKCSAR